MPVLKDRKERQIFHEKDGAHPLECGSGHADDEGRQECEQHGGHGRGNVERAAATH